MLRTLVFKPLSLAYNSIFRFGSKRKLTFCSYRHRPRPITNTLGLGRPNSRITIGFKYPVSWFSILAFFQSSPTVANEEVGIETLISEADDLYSQNKYADIVELLQNQAESENVEILWRLSRALYNLSKTDKTGKSNDLISEAFTIAKRALQLDENHYATHKWYSILLDAYAGSQGIKSRINELINVKKHMMRATELNPADATTLYMLGSWCFGISEMPWYQRQIVAAIFATPPTSSFEEALLYFKKAEEVSPQFYSQNLLMLGKTYMKLQNFKEAIYYLRLASTYPARTDEDNQANKEANELLSQISS